MKTAWVFLLLLGLSTALWPQQMDCPCEQTVTVSDATCTNCDCTVGNCSCEHVTFTASCGGCYKLSASVTACTAGNCTDYTACVFVYEGATLVGQVHNSPCNTTCDGGCYVCLIAGHTYELYACLIQCSNCPSPATCQAKAKLYYCASGSQICPPCSAGCN